MGHLYGQLCQRWRLLPLLLLSFEGLRSSYPRRHLCSRLFQLTFDNSSFNFFHGLLLSVNILVSIEFSPVPIVVSIGLFLPHFARFLTMEFYCVKSVTFETANKRGEDGLIFFATGCVI